MAAKKSTGSGSKRGNLMSSNGEPRRAADAESAKEDPQTKAEETRENPNASHDGNSRRTSRSERAWQERGTQDARSGPGMQGRNPSDEPDVFLDVPKVHVGEIYFDVERLDAHLSLRAKVANLVQIIAGVHVHVGKVELDIKDVDAQAMLKVRLENLYDILDRTLTTLDRNPEILETLLKTVDTAVDDIGHTAQQALGPGGAVGQAVNTVGKVGQQALGPGGAATRAVDQVGGAAQQAVGPGGAATQAAEGVGGAAQQAVQPGGAVSETADAAGQAAQGVGNAAGQATQGVGNTAAQATQGVAQDAQGATQDAQGAGQDAQDAGSSDGKTKKRSPTAADKRGTRIGSAAARSPKRTTSGRKSSSGSTSGTSGTTKRASASKKTSAAKRGSK